MAGSPLVRRTAKAALSSLPPGPRGALIRRLGGRLGLGDQDLGLVSLVVVCESVDVPRLADTLASIRAQAHGFLEVLVVPVGEADASDVVSSLRDPRLRLLDRADTWQGAANQAAATATGGCLGFTRGCDPWPAAAVHVLARSLASSGSVLATGRMTQRGQPDEWLERAQRASHARPGRALAPAERPELAGDLVVGNRLIRSEAWRASGLAFTSDDDWLLAPTLARLLAATETVDVLDQAVVEYLPEHGARPYGAMPSALPALTGWRHRAALVEQTLPPELLAGWVRHVRDVALPRFLKDAERATDQEWRSLRGLSTTYDDHAGAGGSDGVRAESRTLAWLAAQDRRADVIALASEARSLGDDLRTTLHGPDLLAQWEALLDDVPAHVRTLDPDESRLVAEVRSVRPGEADLFAMVERLDLSAVEPAVAATLDDGTALDLAVEHDPAATRWGRSAFQTALRVRVRLPHEDGTSLSLRLTAAGLTRSAQLEVPPAPTPPDTARGQPVVTDVVLDGTTLRVHTDPTGVGRQQPDLRLVDDADRTSGTRAGGDGIDLRDERFGAHTWLAPGRYRVVADRGNPAISTELRGRLPLEYVGPRHRVRVQVGVHGGLVVWLMPPLDDEEQGAHAQQRLVAAYAVDVGPVDKDVLYFESYAGRSATDSPLEIFTELRARRPGLTAYWGIVDHGQRVPDGARPVLLRSRAWYELLARAGCLVVNTDFEAWFRRRPGQVVLQTFHGYPSKAMGEGQWRAKQLPSSQLAVMRARSVDTWSAILTPTPEMTKHYREQYGYAGPAFEHGYPRDDGLRGPAAAERRAATRALLGIRDQQTAVLYAPTWRDHLATRPRGAAMADLLDVPAAAKALGDGHVLMLRGHRFHAHGDSRDNVVDVTGHPEINDLILAADVAVLDYSSIRFDFAITGKPMVFLVPDLAEYDGGTRGFLYPFPDSAPGPLVDDTAGVVAQVRDVPALTTRWSAELVAFNAAYNLYQDGRAASRVVDGLLDLLAAQHTT